MTTIELTHPSFVTVITISPTTTIIDLKTMINNQLGQRGETLSNYKTRFVFGNGTELAPFIFDTNEYDQVNLQQYTVVLPGSKIELTPKPQIKVYILLGLGEDTEDPVEILSRDMVKILRYYISEVLYEENIPEFLTKYKLDRLDFNNRTVVNAILNEIAEDDYYAFVEKYLD